MTEASVIGRILGAAEAWGRSRYHEEVVAVAHADPICCPDGAVTLAVDLDRPASGASVTSVHCIVVMEPDGRVSCLEDVQGLP